ncbi:hypothetical protein HYPSUDRAFT_209639 [Hypholoma sublateritium FD-334 SS-4]|uniref:Secreted protein n=1 Tax=Hypholoma sublateritium (strain FD-334 SS-4) TaxID=945553 RepID=A0A0D2KFV4_HYPSF|nr:hypothetical protein HYPSUDRAFT_209639 [Hypholoma sublateritium FD-334 SS-4]
MLWLSARLGATSWLASSIARPLPAIAINELERPYNLVVLQWSMVSLTLVERWSTPGGSLEQAGRNGEVWDSAGNEESGIRAFRLEIQRRAWAPDDRMVRFGAVPHALMYTSSLLESSSVSQPIEHRRFAPAALAHRAKRTCTRDFMLLRLFLRLRRALRPELLALCRRTDGRVDGTPLTVRVWVSSHQRLERARLAHPAKCDGYWNVTTVRRRLRLSEPASLDTRTPRNTRVKRHDEARSRADWAAETAPSIAGRASCSARLARDHVSTLARGVGASVPSVWRMGARWGRPHRPMFFESSG